MEREKGIIAILGILAISGFIMSGYMFVSNGIMGSDDSDSGFILVGLWDHLDSPYSPSLDFNIELRSSVIDVNNSYIRTTSFERFYLMKPGTYKFTLRLNLGSIEPDTIYIVHLVKNGLGGEIFERIATPLNFTDTNYHVNSIVYETTDGGDYYEINTYSLTDGFYVVGGSGFHQFAIEYLQT